MYIEGQDLIARTFDMIRVFTVYSQSLDVVGYMQ